jgi:hypothetical protein
MLPTSVLIELIAFVCSLYFLRKSKVGYWRAFLWFIGIVLAVEIAGWTMAVVLGQSNHWLYNIELIGEALFFWWVIKKVFLSLSMRSQRWIDIALVVFLTVYVWETRTNRFKFYNENASLVESILLVIAAGTYYFLLLKQPAYENLYHHGEFWIITGIFFFYFGSTTADLFFEELMNINIVEKIPLRYFIFTLLNIILYGCWVYAFKCRYRQTISSGSLSPLL